MPQRADRPAAGHVKPAPPPLPPADLARLIDIALERVDAEAPLMDALDAAVDAHGADTVRHHLLGLAALPSPLHSDQLQ